MKKPVMQAASGLAVACALTSCGRAPQAGPAAGVPPADPPSRDGARFGLLTANAVCPSGLIAGAGTYGGGQAFSFAVVDGGGTDRGRLVVSIGGVPWVDATASVAAIGPGTYRITGDVVHPTSGATTAVTFQFGGLAGPALLLDDVAQVVEAFSDRVPEVDGSCLRFNGGGTTTVTATNPLGGTRTVAVALSFDVTEDGTSDSGVVNLTVDGSTFTGTSPDVAFVGDDLVVADTLILPGQIVGVTEATFRVDLTDPDAAVITFAGGTTATIPLLGFITLVGLCDAGSIP